jgi:hypothetical protein
MGLPHMKYAPANVPSIGLMMSLAAQNASAAYLFTTAKRARDMLQQPIYILH